MPVQEALIGIIVITAVFSTWGAYVLSIESGVFPVWAENLNPGSP
jgi:hypothetical protein